MTDFALFETMRFEPESGIHRLFLHIKRLQRSARRLGFEGAEKVEVALAEFLGPPPSVPPGHLPFKGGDWPIATGHLTKPDPQSFTLNLRPSISSLEGEISGRTEGGKAANAAPSLRLRLELARNGKITITTAPFTLQPENTIWQVRLAKIRTTSTDPLIHHKTTRRDLYNAARREFSTTEADEVILLNEKGEIAEGTITNIFIDDGTGRLLTPPLASGCLAGILRTSLICAKKAVNQRLRPEDLVGKTLYVGNSLRGLIRAELK